MLEICHLSAGYGKREVLRDLSVALEAGKLTAIMGPNGCGKSTLLKAALGLIHHTAGEIRLDGVSASTLKQKALARRIAYLPQGQAVPDMTVEELVLCGRYPYLDYPRGYSSQDRSIARTAMERVGMTSLSAAPLHTLSGGMRQTAYMAMAMAQETDYILLDEPTTYLDISHQLALMKLLRDLTLDGRGIVAVMHDLPLALTYAHRIAVMAEGRVIAEGTPGDVVQSGVIGEVFGVEVSERDGEYACRLRAD